MLFHEELPRKDHHQAWDEQARAAGERAHDEKQGADDALRPRAKAHRKVVVDGVDLVVVVRLEEDICDDPAAEDNAHRELQVGKRALGKPFAGSPQKCRSAGLGGDDTCHHGPPRNLPAREREVFQALFTAAHVEADSRDAGKVEQDDSEVNKKAHGCDYNPGFGVRNDTTRSCETRLSCEI